MTTLCTACAIATCWLAAGPFAQAAPPDLDSAEYAGRVVKTFDFDERSLGNFETIPMHWAMHRAPGFPKYLKAEFDEAVGRAAPPSFRLELLGGSVAATYEGRDVPVHPGSDYRIIAWVRPDRLRFAGAYLSAFYRDKDLQPIEATERIGRPIEGPAARDGWRRIVIDLPGGVSAARWIGLSAWVRQPRTDPGDAAPRPIRRMDVHGGAWFDDITVLRLPRIQLDFNRDPTLFDDGEPIILNVRFEAADDAALEGRLTGRDIDDRIVRTESLRSRGADGVINAVDLSDLPLGWYQAEATLRNASSELTRQTVAFARLLSYETPASAAHRVIGILMPDWADGDREATRDLIGRLDVGAVKAPLWTADRAPNQGPTDVHPLDSLLREFHAEGV
ncbi:MAG: hypothetical protein V3T70_11335, partial [Phycisphaerae bacterium]